MAVLLPLKDAEFTATYETKEHKLTVVARGNTDPNVVVFELERVKWIGGLKFELRGFYGGVNPPPEKHIEATNVELIELPMPHSPSKTVLVQTENELKEVEIRYLGFVPPEVDVAHSDGLQTTVVLPPINVYLAGGQPGHHTAHIKALIPSGERFQDWVVLPKFDQRFLMIWKTTSSAKSVEWDITWLKTPTPVSEPVTFSVITEPVLQMQTEGKMIGTTQPYNVHLVILATE